MHSTNPMRLKYLFALLIIFSGEARAQAPTIEWQTCLGGTQTEGFLTFINGLQQTIDGGYIIGSRTNSNDGNVSGNHGGNCGAACNDGWVVKLDSGGIIQWQKCLGGTSEDVFSAIHETFDGGIIVAGQTNSNDGDVSGLHSGTGGDFWVCKLGNVGNLQWQKCLGGTDDDFALSIVLSPDSGYLIAGQTSSNDGDVSGNPFPGSPFAWITRLNGSGNVIWQKCLPNTYNPGNVSATHTIDGGYIVACTGGGLLYHNNSKEYCMSKVDSMGNLQWQKFYGGNDNDQPNCIRQTRDGGFVMAGYTDSHDGDVTFNHRDTTLGSLLWHDEYWIIKTDSSGNLQFQKSLGGNWNDIAYSIEQCLDGGYIISGQAMSNDGDINNGLHGGGTFGGPGDCWIVKLDSAFGLQWQKCFGGFGDDIGEVISQTSDQGFILKSSSFSNDGDVSGNHGNGDIWIVKLSPSSTGLTTINNPITDFTACLNRTNRSLDLNFYANGNEHTQVQLLDITGRVLLSQPLAVTAGFNKQEVQAGQLAGGVYVVRLVTEGGSVVKKLIKN